jgi:hypothetical protein
VFFHHHHHHSLLQTCPSRVITQRLFVIYVWYDTKKKEVSSAISTYIMFFSWFISLASARTRRSWVHGTKVLVFLINL